MAGLFPAVENEEEELARIVKDDAAFAAGVAAICESHGIRHRPERFASGSRPVYALGPELVLKLFWPWDPGEAEREALFLDVVHGKIPIPTPKLHAEGELDGYRYVLMGRLGGTPLSTVAARIDRAGLRRLAEKLGEALRALHSLRDERLASARGDWSALIQKRKVTTLALQKKRRLDDEWLEQIPDFLEAECGAIEKAPCDSPLHTEVMREHLLVEEANGEWRLSGLFDFEPSMVGAPEYEFSSVGVFFSCGDRELLRDVLLAYGYRSLELDHALERRLFAYALLHEYSNLAWYLERVPPPPELERVEELATHFFGI
jgi:hygromycin-B 7''-O-kinase